MLPRNRLIVAVALIALAPMARAQSAPPSASRSASASGDVAVPGATVDQLLVLARRLNPDVAAAALESEAARARVDAAGRLPDPTFATEFKDIDRQRDSALPEELARVEYKIQQSFPLWGKLELQESGARARARAARETQRATELEIAARIKTIFAAYYAAFESGRVTRDLYGTVATLADVTQSRYAQGLGEQEDAIRAEVEKTRLRTDLVRFGADQRQRAAQLNALLDRAQDAPLAARKPCGRCRTKHWNLPLCSNARGSLIRRSVPPARRSRRRRLTRRWCARAGTRMSPWA